MAQSKEPIRLRKRKTPTELYSRYLDIYLNGQRSYEYLKIYLVPETNRADKYKNQKTMKLAEAIRGKRLVELQNSEYGFKSPFKEDSNFYEYYMVMCKERFKDDTMGNWGNWNFCLKHLLKYEPKLKQLKWINAEEGKRMYLTIEEVQLLAKAECHYPSVKRAFLFSCLTGLRRSDIERLKWKDEYTHHLQPKENKRS